MDNIFNILLKEWEKKFIFNHFKRYEERYRAMAEHLLRNAIAKKDYKEYRASKTLLIAHAPENIKESIRRLYV